MKIIELTRSFYPSIGGMEKFVSDRLGIYKSLGFEYQVITTTHMERSLDGNDRLTNVKYLKSYTPYGITPELGKNLEVYYDVISINQLGYYYSDFAINHAHKTKKKIILTPHFHFHSKKYQLIKDFHSNYILPKNLKKINKMICFTNYEAKYWKDKYPFLEDKIHIIPHFFKSAESNLQDISNEYGKYFLFIGRSDINKRIDLLIHAFNKIETNYKLILTIFEDELDKKTLQIAHKNKNIIFLGRVSENRKLHLLKNCEALILPTDFEAFGIVLLEASNFKKPVLCSDLPVLKEVLKSADDIYFNNNLNSLIEVITKFLLLNEKEKIKIGENNFRNLQRYEFQKITQLYKNVFRELN